MTLDLKVKAIREWAQLCERQEDVIELNPATVIALLDRLDTAESEVLEQARVLSIGSEKELVLMAKLEAAEAQLKQEALARENVSAMRNELVKQLKAAEKDTAHI